MSKHEPSRVFQDAEAAAAKADFALAVKNVMVMTQFATTVYRTARAEGLDRTEAMMLAQTYMSLAMTVKSE